MVYAFLQKALLSWALDDDRTPTCLNIRLTDAKRDLEHLTILLRERPTCVLPAYTYSPINFTVLSYSPSRWPCSSYTDTVVRVASPVRLPAASNVLVRTGAGPLVLDSRLPVAAIVLR